MSSRGTSYKAFHANLSAAGTTLMLCRANLRHLEISHAETVETLWRIKRQIAELEGMHLELSRHSLRMTPLGAREKPCLRSVD